MSNYYTESDAYYRYPAAGHPLPPGGETVHLLTLGGKCIEGTWPTLDCIAWAPFHKRNKEIEQTLKDRK